MCDLHTPNVAAAARYERDHAGPPEDHGITADDVAFTMGLDVCRGCTERDCLVCGLRRVLGGGWS